MDLEENGRDDMNAKETRELILGKVRELVEDLLVNDRKEDQVLPLGAIEESAADLVNGVAVWEMTQEFEHELLQRLPVAVLKPAEEKEE